MNRARPWIPLIVMLGLLLGAAFVFGSSTGNGTPLDPASAKPLGAKGLVEVLRVMGATVQVTTSPPDATTDTAVVLADDFDAAMREQLVNWVKQGGTLLLADPSSPLNPYPAKATTDV